MASGEYIMSMDAGGTMTDAFFVDRDGRFVVGKAQTTPENESIGFRDSVLDGLKYWSEEPAESFPRVVTVGCKVLIYLSSAAEVLRSHQRHTSRSRSGSRGLPIRA